MNTWGVAPGSAPKNAAGATPMISKGLSLIRIVWPSAAAASPKRRRLKVSLKTTTGAAPIASSA